MNDNTFFLKQDISPIKQVIVVISALIVFNIVAFLIQLMGLELGETISWEISLTLLLFFALGNTLFFLNAADKNKYWNRSILSYLGLLIVSILTATIFSGFGINESGSIKWIYFVFSFGYLVFISIIGLIRKIVEIAIKQDEKMRGEQ